MSSCVLPRFVRSAVLASLVGPARWWQFWRPGSGLVGGMIMGSLIAAAGWRAFA